MTDQHPAGATLHLGGDAWAMPSLEPLLVPIETLTLFPGNPRRGDQHAITNSIRDHGLYAGVVTQTTTTHTLVGNHRLRALLDLGATHCPSTPADVDDTRAAQIVARDNLTSDRGGYDDTDQLALLEALAAQDELPGSGYTADDLAALRAAAEPAAYVPPVVAPSLADRFVVPPFSVLDQRAGAWQDRKRRWLALGIQSEVGRSNALIGGQDDGTNGTTKQRNGAYGARAVQQPDGSLGYETTVGSTSIFDPVLTELAYRWFSPLGGHVLDLFAGGSVRGIVAATLGRSYTGVELRPEQVEANIAQAVSIVPRLGQGDHPNPVWHTGDSRIVLAPGSGHDDVLAPADLVFSCPPYADLEVYSDDPADLSAMPYDQFLEAYRAIIAATCARLRDDRFAVWVIGEVRDKRGLYRNLVGDTTRAFLDAGLAYYNEAILVTPVGSLPIRAGRQFAAGRKLGKTHQNVLVFVKGDPRAAADACGTVDVTLPEVADTVEEP